MNNRHPQLVDFLADDRPRWLSNLLADEPQWDRRALLRLGSWAASTVTALVLAMLTMHWSQGGRRDQVAAADLARQSQQLQMLARESQTENRRLAAAIDILDSDRDRLYARVTVVEQGLDSVTGAVTRQSVPPSLVLSSAIQPLSLPPPAISAPPVTPARIAETVALSPPATEASSPTPAAHPPASVHPTTLTTAAEAQRAALSSSTVYAPPDPGAPRLVEAASVAPGSSEGHEGATVKAQEKAQDQPQGEKPATQLLDNPQIRAETRKDPQPEGRTQIANNSPAEPLNIGPPAAPATAAGPPVPEIAAQRTEFGVDLGAANSIEGLRGLWQGLMTSNGAMLSPLRPIIVIRERSNGLGMQLHLVAGPLNDAAAAARICAGLAANSRSCETTVFDGQRLALKAEAEPTPPRPVQRPAAPRPLVQRKHAAARQPKYEERMPPQPPPAPPPPAPTAQSISSSVVR